MTLLDRAGKWVPADLMDRAGRLRCRLRGLPLPLRGRWLRYLVLGLGGTWLLRVVVEEVYWASTG